MRSEYDIRVPARLGSEPAGLTRRQLLVVALLTCGPLPLLSLGAALVSLPALVERATTNLIPFATIPLDADARANGFRVVNADPNVGGRYSALTAFGLVPSGLAGADIEALLDDAEAVTDVLAADDDANPALRLGAAMGGDTGYFFNDGTAKDYALRPPSLTGVTDGFAVLVYGDSMEPRYMRGEIVHVDPSRPLTSGCFVVVELVDGRGMIKQFLRQDGRRVILRQLRPEQELSFERGRIARIARIVGSAER